MGVTRGIAAVGLAGALALASSFGAAPATADDAAGTVRGGGRIVMGGFASARQLVSFTCAASADSPATPVGISRCALLQNGVPIASAPPVSAPGVAAATSNYAVIDLVGPVDVCWTVDATFAVDNSTATQSGCGGGFLGDPPLAG